MSNKKKVIVLNAETTGPDAGSDEILQIAILSDAGDVIFNELIRPERHSEWPEAEKIHGISPAAVQGAETILYYRRDLERILDAADIIVGYNHSFDMAFFAKAGIVSDPRKNYDLMLEFSQLRGIWDDRNNCYRHFSIQECAAYLGYRWPDGVERGCMEECRAALYCYKKMMAGESGEGGTPNERAFQSAFLADPPKKIGLTLALTAAATLLLAGAAAWSVLSMNRETALRAPGIAEDARYTEYSNLRSRGLVDEEDRLLEERVLPLDAEKTGSVRVSFGRNAYIALDYYLDAERTQKIEPGECRLEPGDTIYPGAPNYLQAPSNLYQLDCFEIRQFGGDGNKIACTRLNADAGEIPLSLESDTRELSILPRGKFTNRTLTLRLYTRDEGGNRRDLDWGNWTVNDAPCNAVTGIDPTLSYQVSCDLKEYSSKCYVSAVSPTPFSKTDEKVVFNQETALSGQTVYEIELHPYYTVNVVCNPHVIKGKGIIRDGEKTVYNAEKLKQGDIVYFRLDPGWRLIPLDGELPIEETPDGFRLRVPKSANTVIKVVAVMKGNESETVHIPAFEHASVELRLLLGKTEFEAILRDGAPMPDKEGKLRLTVRPDDGYRLEGEKLEDGCYTVEISVSKYAQKIAELKNKLKVTACSEGKEGDRP